MYKRDLEKSILSWMDCREIIIIYGARQVGKTTLLKMLLEHFPGSLLLNCDRPVVHDILQRKDLTEIKDLFGERRIIALDEAQVVENIGETLKLIYDTFPEYKIIATGSSSFELSNRLSEPLTGRNIKFHLLPISIHEIRVKNEWIWIKENLDRLIISGLYPGIITISGEKVHRKLEELAGDYLFKDILLFEGIKNSSILRNLIKALALQTGSTVSMNELSRLLGINIRTVERYVELLEKTFVIFRLPALTKNQRNEIRKSNKFYFYDNGIRNAVIGNFGLPGNRVDIGALWENFCICERLKYNSVHNPGTRVYFWRTYDGAEIDFVEEKNGTYTAFEFKWNPHRKVRLPAGFSDLYPTTQFKIIHPGNIAELMK